MSSSSSTTPARPSRVLRGDAGQVHPADAPAFDLDLDRRSLPRLDPRRIDDAVEEGRAAGYAAGWVAGQAEARTQAEAGLDAARAEHRARLAEVVARAEAALESALAELRGAVADTEARATDVAFRLAEAIVGHAVAASTDPGREAVQRVLAIAPSEAELVLHLNPGDLEQLDPTGLVDRRSITLVADAALASGDCTAEAGSIHLDGRIEAALARVRSALEVPAP